MIAAGLGEPHLPYADMIAVNRRAEGPGKLSNLIGIKTRLKRRNDLRQLDCATHSGVLRLKDMAEILIAGGLACSR
jgi:hypothetical protein